MNPYITLSLLLLAACPGQEEPAHCTDIEVDAIALTVTDVSGAAIDGFTATWTDGEADPVPCTTGLTEAACGWDAGEYTIHVEAAGYVSQDQVVVVESDGCHPITEAVTVALVAM